MFMSSHLQKFYTYIHRRRSDGSVFYVGKGLGHRAWWRHGRSQQWIDAATESGWTHEIVARFDREEEAFEHERSLIALYRAAGVQLVNHTDGGEGPSGFRFSDDQRRALSVAQRATWARPNYKMLHALSQKIALAEPSYRRKLRDAMVARWADPERRPVIGRHDKNPHARPVTCIDTGQSFGSVSLAVLWLRAIGVASAAPTRIVACCKGRGRSAYGYHWHYADRTLTAEEIVWRLEGYSKGARHYRARAIRCLETGATFPTQTEAVTWFSEHVAPTTSGEMSACCKFEQRHIRGFHFHFADTPPTAAQLAWMREGRPSGARAYCARKIVCVETGQLFETITAATEWVKATTNPKASIGNISSCAMHGKPKSAYGYHWQFA